MKTGNSRKQRLTDYTMPNILFCLKKPYDPTWRAQMFSLPRNFPEALHALLQIPAVPAAINQSKNQSMNQLVDETVNQYITKSNNQLINQLVTSQSLRNVSTLHTSQCTGKILLGGTLQNSESSNFKNRTTKEGFKFFLKRFKFKISDLSVALLMLRI